MLALMQDLYGAPWIRPEPGGKRKWYVIPGKMAELSMQAIPPGVDARHRASSIQPVRFFLDLIGVKEAGNTLIAPVFNRSTPSPI